MKPDFFVSKFSNRDLNVSFMYGAGGDKVTSLWKIRQIDRNHVAIIKYSVAHRTDNKWLAGLPIYFDLNVFNLNDFIIAHSLSTCSIRMQIHWMQTKTAWNDQRSAICYRYIQINKRRTTTTTTALMKKSVCYMHGRQWCFINVIRIAYVPYDWVWKDAGPWMLCHLNNLQTCDWSVRNATTRSHQWICHLFTFCWHFICWLT